VGINAVFEALSHPVRRKVLALLKAGPMSAGELAEHFDLTRPTLSVLIYHLNTSVLEQALADVLSLREEK
jgi:DNA-binding transcriptional ArsR family regulator